MIVIDNALKDLYKQRNIPKSLSIYFPGLGLTINNDKLVSESLEISEQICSSDDLEFGACEASMIKFTCANIVQDLTDQEFTIIQTLGSYMIPLGTYKVVSCEKKNDRWFRDVVAYDSMKNMDVDVSAWYNNLTFPITVKNMRISLLTHLGLQYDEQTLTNDSVQLAKTINPASLLGRDVLKRLCQINAGFGHFTRLNKFKVIQLSALGLYPSETLYPAEDLFPAESGELLTAGYKSIHYEEYMVEPITKLQISQDDGDEGVVVGTGDNTYVITENFLLYGKTAAELQAIANNILLQIKNKYYRPHETVMIGLPYLEVGDTLTIITGNDAIETFIFTRTLKGIQALEDTVTAAGSQKRSNNVGLSTQVQQLKGRTLKIQKNVDELSSTVTDLEENTETRFQQTATAISLKANASDVNSQFLQTANSIALKVDKNGVISAINVSNESIKLAASKIALEGIVTANSRFKILLDGSMEAVNGKFSGTLTSTSGGYDVKIENGKVYTTYNNYVKTFLDGQSLEIGSASDFGIVPSARVAGGYFFVSDGYTTGAKYVEFVPSSGRLKYSNGYSVFDFIHSGNIGSYSVGSANAVPAGGSLGSFTISPGGGFISYAGASKDNPSGYVYIGSQTVQAATIQQISERAAKENIKPFIKNATQLICDTPIRMYTLKDNEEDKKTHVGVVIDEAPEVIIGAGGNTISLYDMISVAWKAIQEQKKEITELKATINELLRQKEAE